MTNVVIVDDYVDFAETIKEFIENFNEAKCFSFSNPFDALKHIENESNVNVLITDYQMPQMNGFELAEIVVRKYPQIRVIVSSGHDKSTLNHICEEYDLKNKIEVVCKSDTSFFMNLL